MTEAISPASKGIVSSLITPIRTIVCPKGDLDGRSVVVRIISSSKLIRYGGLERAQAGRDLIDRNPEVAELGIIFFNDFVIAKDMNRLVSGPTNSRLRLGNVFAEAFYCFAKIRCFSDVSNVSDYYLVFHVFWCFFEVVLTLRKYR